MFAWPGYIFAHIYLSNTTNKLPGVHSTTVQHETTHDNVNLKYFYYRSTQFQLQLFSFHK